MTSWLQGVGAKVHEQQAVGRNSQAGVTGPVRNVVGQLRGRKRDAILLSARLDTSCEGPEVSSTALGIATLAEVARVLSARPGRRHDLILLAVDGGATGDIGVRAFARSSPLQRRVRFELHLAAPGTAGDPILLGAGRGAAAGVEAYSRAVDRPGGGSELGALFGPSWPRGSGRLRWPWIAVGPVDAPVWPGDPLDRLGHLPIDTLAAQGQAAVNVLLALDSEDLTASSHGSPAWLELPSAVMVSFDEGSSLAAAWLAVLFAVWSVFRARRAAAQLALCAPWLAVAAGGALLILIGADELIRAGRGSDVPLRLYPASHIVAVVLAGVVWLLVWQRCGMHFARRIAAGLSDPVSLLVLAVVVFATASIVSAAAQPRAVHLFWGPLLASSAALVWSARATSRRQRFAAAVAALAGTLLIWGPSLRRALPLLVGATGSLQQAGAFELSVAICSAAAFLVPPTASVLTAGVLRAGLGQIVLVSLMAVSLAVFSATARLASPAVPRRIELTAAAHSRPTRSLFLVGSPDGRALLGRRAPVPWWGRALPLPPAREALRAPSGLVAPPYVQAHRRAEKGGSMLVEALVRPLRAVHELILVVSPSVRVLQSSVPLVRARQGAPWVSRQVDPPRDGVRYSLRVRGKLRLSDLVAIDIGHGQFEPLLPRLRDRVSTRIVTRAIGVTPFDTVYPPPLPPPPPPPEEMNPERAGPQPGWIVNHQPPR